MAVGTKRPASRPLSRPPEKVGQPPGDALADQRRPIALLQVPGLATVRIWLARIQVRTLGLVDMKGLNAILGCAEIPRVAVRERSDREKGGQIGRAHV